MPRLLLPPTRPLSGSPEPWPPGASCSQCLPVGMGGSPRQPCPPFPGDDTAELCHLWFRSVPSARLGGPAPCSPWETAVLGNYRTFPAVAPPVTGTQPRTVLPPASWWRGPLSPGPQGLLDWRAPAPWLQESLWLPALLCSWALGLGQEGGVAVGAAALTADLPHQALGSDHRKATAGPATLAQPCPKVTLPLGWTRPHLPRTTGGQSGLAWLGSTVRGRWASPRHPRPVCPGGPAPWPHAPSVPLPTGCHLAHRMPPRACHAAVCGLALSPWGWVGTPFLPIYSLPRAFLCRFLNVILEWKMRL